MQQPDSLFMKVLATVAVGCAVTVIARDIQAAARAGGQGTPTILVNGMRLAGAPDSAKFDRLIRDALDAGLRGDADVD